LCSCWHTNCRLDKVAALHGTTPSSLMLFSLQVALLSLPLLL
jgi:hypothetical protein